MNQPPPYAPLPPDPAIAPTRVPPRNPVTAQTTAATSTASRAMPAKPTASKPTASASHFTIRQQYLMLGVFVAFCATFLFTNDDHYPRLHAALLLADLALYAVMTVLYRTELRRCKMTYCPGPWVMKNYLIWVGPGVVTADKTLSGAAAAGFMLSGYSVLDCVVRMTRLQCSKRASESSQTIIV